MFRPGELMKAAFPHLPRHLWIGPRKSYVCNVSELHKKIEKNVDWVELRGLGFLGEPLGWRAPQRESFPRAVAGVAFGPPCPVLGFPPAIRYQCAGLDQEPHSQSLCEAGSEGR